MRLVVDDILLIKEYAITAIYHYMNIPEEGVEEEIFALRNRNPSKNLIRRLIELHRLVECVLYCEIRKKLFLNGCKIFK